MYHHDQSLRVTKVSLWPLRNLLFFANACCLALFWKTSCPDLNCLSFCVDLTSQTRQYNTPSFLILSVAAVLSSTAIAVLSPNYTGREKGLVFAEATVIFAFLIIIGHVLRSLSRSIVFRLNGEVTHSAKYLITSEGSELIVQVISKHRLALVAEKLSTPKLLIATVVITALAATVTIVGASFAMYKFRSRKSTEEEV